MTKFTLLAALLLLFLNNSDAISPAKDARTHFSATFYRRTIFDLGKTKDDFAVSPAATQKFLVAVYKGMERSQADQLLFDIGIKHIDFERLLKETYEETGTHDTGFSLHLRRKQFRELAPIIEKQEVIDLFKPDFEGTSNSINVENYIVVPDILNSKLDYQKFAKEYFNVDLVHAKTDIDKSLQTKFGVNEAESEKVQLYSNVELNLRVANSGGSTDTELHFDGAAKYYEDEDFHYIELHLENDLKLFMAVANEAKEFNYYITQRLGRSVEDFDEYYADKWSTEQVKVIMPIVNFTNVNDLAVNMRDVAQRGLQDALKTNAKLSEAFENWPENGPNIEHYWQRVAVKIEPSAARIGLTTDGGPLNLELKVVNTIGRNFFYVIKDKTSYYAMGSYIGEKSKN